MNKGHLDIQKDITNVAKTFAEWLHEFQDKGHIFDISAGERLESIGSAMAQPHFVGKQIGKLVEITRAIKDIRQKFFDVSQTEIFFINLLSGTSYYIHIKSNFDSDQDSFT